MKWLKRLIRSESSSGPATNLSVASTNTTQNTTQGSPNHSTIGAIIAVASGKGGVGKSTVTAMLALAYRHLGLRVGVLDADVYGPSQPAILGSRKKTGVADGLIQPVYNNGIAFVSMPSVTGKSGAVVVRAPIAVKTITQLVHQVAWGSLDVLLIDMPPGTGDIQLSIAQKIALDGAIVVTTPQKLAVEIAEKSVEMFQRVSVPVVGVIENMSHYQCPHCHQTQAVFDQSGGSHLAQRHDLPLLAQLPLSPALLQVTSEGGLQWQADEAPMKIMSAAVAQIQQRLVTLRQQALDEPSELIISPDQTQLTLAWPGKSSQQITSYQLRLKCQCALCRDEHTGDSLIDTKHIDQHIKLVAVKKVGRYGFGARFSDGHTTGIYRYKRISEEAS